MDAKYRLKLLCNHAVTQWRKQSTPYVWTLALSLEFFEKAERMIAEAVCEDGNADFLEAKTYAPIALIMLGEWYKRRYTGSSEDTPEWVKLTDWKEVWLNCEVRNWRRWVYRFKTSGNYSWLYSGMVLGGLACVFEGRHDAKNRLLHDFCCLFHGDDSVEPDASDRSLAIEESISREGSIYHFIMELTDTNSALSHAYSIDAQEDVRNLRNNIIEINRQVTRSKLQSEWIITTSPYQKENLSKTLRVRLRPERVNGEKRWFLSQQRAEEWGFKNAKNIEDITLMVRFYNEGSAVDDIPVLHFQTSGKASAGFNTIEPDHVGYISRLPHTFDAWQLVATSNDGQNIIVDATVRNVGEFAQIYQTATNPQQWGTNYRRRPSVVIFSDRCVVTDPENHPVATKRTLVDYQPREQVNWAEIPSYVVLKYHEGDHEREVRLVSPLAGCKVLFTRQYTDLISYLPGGGISVRKVDSETREETERQMPLLFGNADNGIMLSWNDDAKSPVVVEPEDVLYRQNGMETIASDLREGIVEVTAYARGMEAKAEAWYIPLKGQNVPLIRDLDKQIVRWCDGKKFQAGLPDETTGLLAPTISTERGSVFHDKAVIDVYQPVRRREVLLHGGLKKVDESDGPLNLALLNLADIAVRIFDATGFHEWLGIQNLNQFRSLVVPQSNIVKADRGNIVIHNSQANVSQNGKGKKFGIVTMIPDIEGEMLEYPAVKQEKPKGPFEPKLKDISASEALEYAIEYNLYSFYFNSIRVLKGDVIPIIDEILAIKDEDFLKSHSHAIKRILWENNKKVKDLHIKI